jgi:chromosome segregation ATPase
MDNLAWLRERTPDLAPFERSKRVVRVSNPPQTAGGRDGESALSLVQQAAEVIRGIEDRASEAEKYARGVAEKAVARLQIAEERIRELEVQRGADAACINDARIKIQEAAELLRRERARVEAAENQLHKLEIRAQTAEAHAEECESALARIESAIRTQLLRQGRLASH